jgi:hypothetical protein
VHAHQEDYFVFGVSLNIVIPGRCASKVLVSFPHPEQPRSGVSKDEAEIGPSWFETREDALLTMRG